MKKILLFFLLLLLTGSLVMAQTVQISGTVTSSDDDLAVRAYLLLLKGPDLASLQMLMENI